MSSKSEDVFDTSISSFSHLQTLIACETDARIERFIRAQWTQVVTNNFGNGRESNSESTGFQLRILTARLPSLVSSVS